VAGLWLGSRAGWSPLVWALLTALAAAAVAVSRAWVWRRGEWRLPRLAFLLALTLGGLRAAWPTPLADPELTDWAARQTRVVLEGRVVGLPEVGDGGVRLRVQLSRGRAVAGTALGARRGVVEVGAPAGTWACGSRVRLEGRLTTPDPAEGFSYGDYLRRQGVVAQIAPRQMWTLAAPGRWDAAAALCRLRQRLLGVIERLFPGPEGAFVAGILLGVDHNMPPELQRAFQVTGAAHIIAISGFNITLIAGLASAATRRWLGRRRAVPLTLAAVWVYALLAGASASVLRAAAMGSLALLATVIGRRGAALNALVLAAAVMLALEPRLLGDIGFQLSFMATLGLILYANPLQVRLEGALRPHLPSAWLDALAGPLGEFLLVTLAAQITTWPLTLYYFGRVSLAILPVNLAVLPIQPLVMILSGAATLAGALWLPLGRLLAALAWPSVAYTLQGVAWAADHLGPGLTLLGFGATPLAAYYAALLLLTLGLPATRPRLSWRSLRPAPLLMALILLTGVIWRGAARAPDGRLHLVLLDGGEGQALLLTSPRGRRLLIGGEPSARQLTQDLTARLAWPTGGLDWLIVPGGTATDCAGLVRTIEQFPPQGVIWLGPRAPAGTGGALLRALGSAGIPYQPGAVGQSLDLGGGAQLTVLATGDQGALLEVRWQAFRVWLPLGVDKALLAGLPPPDAPLTAYLLADGGRAALNPPAWLAALQPEVFLLSVGVANGRGLPDPATLTAAAARPILRTDRHGWIELSSDGTQLWVTTERR
jgi:competence protein ComEC